MKTLLLYVALSSFCFGAFKYARDTTRVWFLGDSHTEGSGTMGYRDHLLHYMDSLGYRVKPVGNRRTNYAGVNPGYGYAVPYAHSFHQGINGISAATYRPLVKDSLRVNLHGQYSNIPHIAIVWLGANDIANGSFTTTTINNNISGLLDSIWVVDDEIQVLLINVTLFQRAVSYTIARQESILALNNKLVNTVASKVSAGKYCKLIDMYSVTLDSNYTQSDGIHFTNVANHDVVAMRILPFLRQAIDTVYPRGDVYPTYYNNWCMGSDDQWSMSNAWYLSTKTYAQHIGKTTHVIVFNTRDNMIDSGYAPYFSITQEYVANGGTSRDSIDYCYNGVANPQGGAASWESRGTIFHLRDSLHAKGRKILIEMQGVTATNGANAIIIDSAKTEVFTTAVANWIYRHNFDGTDFNVESGITFDSLQLKRFFRLLREKLPNKVITAAPVVTHTALYQGCKSYIDFLMPQHYAYALNDQPPNGNAVFLNSPLHLSNIPAGSNHQSLLDVNPYYSYTQPWSVIDWASKGWKKEQLVVLLSTEANPFRGVDTMFSWVAGGKPFWADTVAHLMKYHGGSYYFDSVHIGGYIAGVADSTISYRGVAINEDSSFYIPILAPRALDSIVMRLKALGFKNYGLFDISTDARTPASVKTPLHDHLGSLLTIGADSIAQKLSGDAQSAVVKSVLQPYVVRIVDDYGYGIPGVPVSFNLVSTPGGASGQHLSATETLTDANGYASTVLTLGNKRGSYVVSADAGGDELTFTATGTVTLLQTRVRK